MKKYIVTMIAALALTSCSSNTEVTSNEATCNEATCADTCAVGSYLDTTIIAPAATSVETSTVK